MRINVSQVLAWQTCPRVWWFRYVAQRAKPPGQALADGTFWHERAASTLRADLSAEWAKGEWGGAAAGRREAPGSVLVDIQGNGNPVYVSGEMLTLAVNDEQARMAAWIGEHLRARLADYEVLALEQPLAAALGGHELVGTPDGIVRQRVSGALYLLQWKTVAGARPLDVLFDEVRVSWHECAFDWQQSLERLAEIETLEIFSIGSQCMV